LSSLQYLEDVSSFLEPRKKSLSVRTALYRLATASSGLIHIFGKSRSRLIVQAPDVRTAAKTCLAATASYLRGWLIKLFTSIIDRGGPGAASPMETPRPGQSAEALPTDLSHASCLPVFLRTWKCWRRFPAPPGLRRSPRAAKPSNVVTDLWNRHAPRGGRWHRGCLPTPPSTPPATG